MTHPTVGAAAAVSALFFCLLLGCAASFKLTRFRVYLLLGLSCLFRGIGYAVRASNIESYSAAKAGTYLALASAGYGISLAVICLLLGCWWKNADAGAGRRRLAVASRLLIAPVIILGPISGAVLAGLIYGGNTALLSDAQTLRRAVGWGMLAVLIVLTINSLLAAMLAWRGQQQRQRAQQKLDPHAVLDFSPDLLVLFILACCALLLISGSFRVATIYHTSLPDHDTTFYPVQTLPELLEVCLLLWPQLMPRAALGAAFHRWWQATHGGAAAEEGAEGDLEDGSSGGDGTARGAAASSSKALGAAASSKTLGSGEGEEE